MKKMFLLLGLLVLVVSCTQTNIPPEKQCQVDGDCIPSSCCHSTDAVNKNYPPDCEGIICTVDCQGGTLDCGQGEIKCLQNQCTAVIF